MRPLRAAWTDSSSSQTAGRVRVMEASASFTQMCIRDSSKSIRGHRQPYTKVEITKIAL